MGAGQDRRLHHRPGGISSPEYHCPPGDRVPDQAHCPFCRFDRDQRANIGAGIGRIANHEPVSQNTGNLKQVFIHPPVDKDPLDRDTDLTGL